MALAPAVEAEIGRKNALERDRYLNALAAFEMSLEKCNNLDALYELAAETLLSNIGTTMCRVSVLNEDHSQLTTRALKTIRPFANISSEDTSFSSHILPWHNMALLENRLLLINQEDPASCMDAGEADAMVFKEMRSALIIPIVINGLAFGMITLGEMRQWDRFAYDSAAISFSKALASRLANGIKLVQLSRAILKPESETPLWENNGGPVRSVRSRLKEPLTTMQGSIDLLKMKGFGTQEASGRLVGMLEQSADRLMAILKEE